MKFRHTPLDIRIVAFGQSEMSEIDTQTKIISVLYHYYFQYATFNYELGLIISIPYEHWLDMLD